MGLKSENNTGAAQGLEYFPWPENQAKKQEAN
jgi:hypothetical protein